MSEEKAEITGTRPCDGLRVDLKRCLLQSPCCLKDKKTPLEYPQTNDVASECQVRAVCEMEMLIYYLIGSENRLFRVQTEPS